MTQTEKDALESVYSKLYESALQLDAALNSGGYECDWGWYNHGVDPNTGDVVPYPVPVFTVYGVGGIAITPEGSMTDSRQPCMRERASGAFDCIPFIRGA